ncbi:DUF2798 domain-containing protein [Sinorhizobium meliloti]|nr:DUF2798 domain-containing protein [Sinorhizobium meliloti]
MQIDREQLMRRKLPPGYARVLMPLVLSIFMSGVVSAVTTVSNIGPGASFTAAWPNAWVASWMVAFPTLLVVLPLVRRLVAIIVEQPR